MPGAQAEAHPALTDLKMRKLVTPNMTKVRPVPKATMASMERGAAGGRRCQRGLAGHRYQVLPHPQGRVLGTEGRGDLVYLLLSQEGSSTSKTQGGLSKGGAPFTQGMGCPSQWICFSTPK